MRTEPVLGLTRGSILVRPCQEISIRHTSKVCHFSPIFNITVGFYRVIKAQPNFVVLEMRPASSNPKTLHVLQVADWMRTLFRPNMWPLAAAGAQGDTEKVPAA